MTEPPYIFRTLTYHYEVNIHSNSYRLMTLSEFTVVLYKSRFHYAILSATRCEISQEN